MQSTQPNPTQSSPGFPAMNSSPKNLLLSLLFSLFSLSHSRPSPENHLLLPSNSELAGYNSLYCDSWRFSVETNNARNWKTIPSQCKDFVEKYMNGEKYISDSKIATNYSLNYAKTIEICGDGKDAWVFDIDETLISDLSYYQAHGYGSEMFDEDAFSEWEEQANAPALPASLNLYKELQQLGFTIFLLTGRTEPYRNATEANLRLVGYDKWERLLLRGPSDHEKLAVDYKSERRKQLVDQGYRIRGNSGDQWSDLVGYAVAERSFKLPNPMYYIA